MDCKNKKPWRPVKKFDKKIPELCNQSDTRCRQQAASGAYNILFVITHLLSWMTGNHKFITKQPMSIKICTGDGVIKDGTFACGFFILLDLWLTYTSTGIKNFREESEP